MANMFNTGIEDLGTGIIVWGTSNTYVRLLKVGYNFDNDHDFLDDTSAGTMSQGVGPTSMALTGETTVLDTGNNKVQFDATNSTYTALAAGDTPSQVVIYKYNAADGSAELLCRNVLTPTVPAPNGGDYTIVWDGEGVFEISN